MSQSTSTPIDVDVVEDFEDVGVPEDVEVVDVVEVIKKIEKFPLIKLYWLIEQVNFVYAGDKDKIPQVKAALKKCVKAYDGTLGGYYVEYSKKEYEEGPIGRRYASCGMQSMPRAFRAIIAKSMKLTDWDMVNSQPTLLVQLCAVYGIDCDHLTSYCNHRDAWLDHVADTVNIYFAESDEEPKRPSITTKEAKQLFIRVVYLGGTTNWYKKIGYKGTKITDVESLCKEMTKIADRFIALYPALHKYVQELDRKEFIDNE
jgi:hypothetical protein